MAICFCPYLSDEALWNLILLDARMIEPALSIHVASLLHTSRKVCKESAMVSESFAANDTLKLVTTPVLVVFTRLSGHRVRRYWDKFTTALCEQGHTRTSSVANVANVANSCRSRPIGVACDDVRCRAVV